jgi:hypothetical protein
MANWSLPTLSSLYTAVISAISDRLDDAAKWFDSGSTSPTNLPTGTKRWNAAGNKFEKWSGSAWSDLAASYAIDISGTAANAGNISSGVALSNIGSGGLSYSYLQNISATKRLLGRNSAGAGVCQEVTLSQLLDWVGSAAHGDILYRGASGWARLGAGTSGQVLTTQGTGANPTWGTGITIASTAEAQTGTDNTKVVTPLRLREGLNASGTAPVYACRAWVNFNGTGTVAIRASGNVSSITDNNTGDYTVNFTTALPDADYVVVAHGTRTGTGPTLGTLFPHLIAGAAATRQVPTTAGFRIACQNFAGGAFDDDRISVAVFR